MKNLENYGVQEMNSKKMVETNGGGPIADFAHWLTNMWRIREAPGYVHSQYGI